MILPILLLALGSFHAALPPKSASETAASPHASTGRQRSVPGAARATPPQARSAAPGSGAAQARDGSGRGSSGRRESATEKLDRLAEAFVRTALLRNPWLAFERRWPDSATLRFDRFGPGEGLVWSASLADLRSQLDEVPVEHLSLPQVVEHEVLDHWIEARMIELEARSTHHWNALVYVDHIEHTLAAATRAEWLTPAERWAQLSRILLDVPGLWDKAQKALVSPSREWNELAVPRLLDLNRYLDGEVRASLETAELAPTAVRQFTKLLDEAIGATEDHRRWLLGVPPLGGGASHLLNADDWDALVRHVSGTSLSSSNLKARLLREVARLERELGLTWRPRRASLEELDPKRIGKRIQEGSRTAMQVATRAGLFPFDDAERFPLQPRAYVAISSPGDEVLLIPGRGTSGILCFEATNPGWAPAVQETRSTLFNPSAQLALGIREGLPGTLLFQARVAEHEEPLARYLWNRSVHEGWGLYTLDWILRVDWVKNPLREDEELRREAARARLLATVRLLASIDVHAEKLSKGVATEAFRRRSGFDRESAEREVCAAIQDPLYGIGALGALELRELEEQLARDLPAPKALKRTLAYALEYPHLRPSDLRRLLARERR